MTDPYRLLWLVLLPIVSGCGGKGSTYGSMRFPEGATECPAAADVDPSDLTVACAGHVVSVDGAGLRIGWCPPSPGDTDLLFCEYPVTATDVDTACVCGRPYAVGGEERLAPLVHGGTWASRVAVQTEGLDAATRERQAAWWARMGQQEHASVAAFARFALQLLAVGAPPDLLLAAHSAARDEVMHARLAFGIASAFAGHPVGPGPLAIGGDAEVDLVGLAIATAREGCIAETLSALELAEARDRETDPAIRSALATIVEDETRHAALRLADGALGDRHRWDPVRRAVAEVFAAEGSGRGWREVVGPAARQLLA